MIKKKLYVITLCSILTLTNTIPAFASENRMSNINVNETTIQKDNQILFDCFDSKKEKELLQKNNSKNGINLKAGESKTLTFDDGSKITYELEKIKSLPLSRSVATNGYRAKKTFFYGVASATVYLAIKVSYSGRSVTIESADASYNAKFAQVDLNDPVIVRRTGTNNTYADCYVKGSFSVKAPYIADIYSESIKVGCKVDPADSRNGFYVY